MLIQFDKLTSSRGESSNSSSQGRFEYLIGTACSNATLNQKHASAKRTFFYFVPFRNAPLLHLAAATNRDIREPIHPRCPVSRTLQFALR